MFRRPLVAAALGALLVTGVPQLASADEPQQTLHQSGVSARPKAPRPVGTLTAPTASVLEGAAVTLRATHPKRALRGLTKQQKRRVKVVLERRVTGAWKRLGVQKPKRRGASFATTAVGAPGTAMSFRAYAKLGNRRLSIARLRLPVGRTVTPTVLRTLSATPAGRDANQDVRFAVEVGQAQSTDRVLLERYDAGTWQVLKESALDAAGRATLTQPALNHPAWFRVRLAGADLPSVLTTTPVRTAWSYRTGVIAHRAGAGVAPEQTLAAVRAALAGGATSMEIDVQLTSDGVPIIVHDPTFARTSDVTTVFPGRAGHPVGSFTLAEVKQLDAGSWYGPQWAGERIPTLDEVLAEINGRAHLVLEVKDPEAAGNAGIRAVLDDALATGALGDAAAAGRLTVSSFGIDWLESFAIAYPEIPVGALTTLPPTAAQLDAWDDWAEEVHMNFYVASRAAVDAVRAHGMTTSLWTPKTVADLRRAIGTGAEHVITDNIGLVPEVVDPPAPR